MSPFVPTGALRATRDFLLSTLPLIALASPALAQAPAAEPAPAADPGLTVVVTPLRQPTAIQRVGSAVSVIREEEIERRGDRSLADVLRGVPGVTVVETGGPGGLSSVRLRGADVDQTLVLIDGVRVNDPTTTGGEFDLSTVPVALIERVEVLRGPQSALYGSSAIGGVVNIITKRADGRPRISAQVEAGSYGTVAGAATVAGRVGGWSYALGASGERADGFSSFGYRIERHEARNPSLEDDGFERVGGFGRLSFDAGTGFRFGASGLVSNGRADFDGFGSDAPNESQELLLTGSGFVEVDTLDGRWTHRLELFGTRSDRDLVQGAFLPGRVARIDTDTEFDGSRRGFEYQSRIDLARAGSLILGARRETETAELASARFTSSFFAPAFPRRTEFDLAQNTNSLFALWQVPATDRLDLSLGVRADDVEDVDTFVTWRATGAYRLPETGTVLRASAGTGAKAPSLYQLYEPQYGNAALAPERSFGVDAGFEQALFGYRANLSVTGFYNRFDDLIGFTNRYVNIQEATSYGAEVAVDAALVQDLLAFRAAYTYTVAQDGTTGLRLLRIPRHSARLSLAITPTPDWTIEPSVTLVSERLDFDFPENATLDAYARLDVYTSYRVNPNVELYARAENLTDARYEEVLDYGVTGRAFYAGLRATW